MAVKISSRSGGEPVLLKKMAHFRPEGRGECVDWRRKERGERESGKEISGNFGCISGMLIE
ncbi:hypothetical protein [Desulfovibrio piger]|uniref:hypothetical protein n=1 Tax=Desulfovibrio piger TaxID=901 RepID=UPI00242A3F5E|nr:hypothetical protein [Desulfovibrio piger]MCI6939900.1 hypothetical protein [Desulfovibrio piger]